MLTQNDLDRFCGTENWYRHAIMPGVSYTDGVKYMADQAGAYWLIDEIALMQLDKKVKGEELSEDLACDCKPCTRCDEECLIPVRPGHVATCTRTFRYEDGGAAPRAMETCPNCLGTGIDTETA